MNFTIEVCQLPRLDDSEKYLVKVGDIEKVARVSGCALATLKPEEYSKEVTYQVFKKIKEGMMDYVYRKRKGDELQTD